MDELWKNKIFAIHTMAAAGSVTLGTAITYPLDTVKVLVQVGSGTITQLNAAKALEKVRYFSGYSGLFSGFGWFAFGRVFGMGARFGTYELVTAFYRDGRRHSYVSPSEALMAGMVAGAAESVISAPLEIIKLRAQVSSASSIPSSPSVNKKGAVAPVIEKLIRGYTPDKKALSHSVDLLSILTNRHPNMASALQSYPWMMTGSGAPPSVSKVRRPSEIVSFEGWRAMWRGLRPGLVRDSIYSGVFFSTWQFLHLTMLDWKAVGMDPIPSLDEDIGPLSPLAVSLAAGFSGSFAAAASHCFDTAKCRSLCTVLPKFISLERKFLKWNRPGSRFERMTGIHPSDRNVLFKGVWLRMARCGLASFFIVGYYFLAVDQLVSRGNRLT